MQNSSSGTAATQQDIADMVGCSQNTVALALRDSPRISEARRCEIKKVARRIGYRTNQAARSLRRGRTGLIGVFTGPFDHVRLLYVRRIFEELAQTEYTPIFGVDESRAIPWYRAPWIDTMRELQVELLVSFAWHDEARLPAWSRQLPIVLSGFRTGRMPNCDCIHMDRNGAARTAVKHLLERGYDRVEMLVQSKGSGAEPVTDSYRNLMKEVERRGRVLAPRNGESELDMVRRYIQVLRRRRRPTGVFVLPTSLGALLCNTAMAAGLRVPDDLAIVGYDYMQWVDRLSVPLTTVEQPLDTLVRKTVAAVERRLAKPNVKPVHEILPFDLVEREST